jgi:Fe-S-cluster-containing hydrogenase component 2
VIQMQKPPPAKPGLLAWLAFGVGPGPGQPRADWVKRKSAKPPAQAGAAAPAEAPKLAVKCDMCKGIEGGASCVRACPTGAAIRVKPEQFLAVARRQKRVA